MPPWPLFYLLDRISSGRDSVMKQLPALHINKQTNEECINLHPASPWVSGIFPIKDFCPPPPSNSVRK